MATAAKPLRPLVAIAPPPPTTDTAAAAAAASDAKQTGVTPKPQCSFFSQPAKPVSVSVTPRRTRLVSKGIFPELPK